MQVKIILHHYKIYYYLDFNCFIRVFFLYMYIFQFRRNYTENNSIVDPVSSLEIVNSFMKATTLYTMQS